MVIYPIGTHGLYLPPIKVWNNFFQLVEESYGKGFQIEGAISDLLLDNPNAKCTECGESFIRMETEIRNPYFVSGLIYCPGLDFLKTHPKRAWVEVWPDANAVIPLEKRKKIPANILIANRFKFSDPIIKDCFNLSSIILSEFDVECNLNEGMAPQQKPIPAYSHS